MASQLVLMPLVALSKSPHVAGIAELVGKAVVAQSSVLGAIKVSVECSVAYS